MLTEPVSILDVVHGLTDSARLPGPEADPFSDDGALAEAQLLSVLFESTTNTAALLFELRMAIQIRESNVAILVAKDVEEFGWLGGRRPTRFTAWVVNSLRITAEADRIVLDANFFPAAGATVRLSAPVFEFYTGEVAGMSDTPPDYSELTAAEADLLLPVWGSPVRLTGASGICTLTGSPRRPVESE